MNKRQLEAAKKVIDEDATGVGSLIDGDASEGEAIFYCALGGLGKAAGLTDDQLRREDERHQEHSDENWMGNPGLYYPLLSRRLKDKFGIERAWIEFISDANDRNSTLRRRRVAVKKVLDRLQAKGTVAKK